MNTTIKRLRIEIKVPPGLFVPEIENDLTRREFLIGAGLLVLAPYGCGSGGEIGEDEPSAETRTIEHKYGSTEVSGELARVVSIGYNDHDAILALGVRPVAARYWFGDEDDVIFPWAEGAFASAEGPENDIEILNMPEGLNFERIAALEPDIIVGLYSGMTEGEYETLSQIAPTIAQSDEYIDFGMPWQETTEMIGHALGREEQARELVAGLEARFASARERHPEFEGKSIAVAYYKLRGTENIAFLASQDPRARFFTDLGFEIPDRLDRIADDRFEGLISTERVGLLETDVLVWSGLELTEGGRTAIEDDPLVQRLEVMQEGRAVFVPVGEISSALNFGTVLSLPFALDGLVPMLAAAVDGDPETEVRSAS